jgi:hypothetical protein
MNEPDINNHVAGLNAEARGVAAGSNSHNL